jgi:hypothetical protein
MAWSAPKDAPAVIIGVSIDVKFLMKGTTSFKIYSLN